MASVINLETDVRFDPSKWIRVGKIYKDVPVEVSDAFTDTRKLPPELQATLPGPTLSVTEFLELKFLGVLDSWDRSKSTKIFGQKRTATQGAHGVGVTEVEESVIVFVDGSREDSTRWTRGFGP
ncbi:hypothetical protein B0H13DRAFT_1865742 [Mycena leptocephala]|nr:hypothetical protein B0H13DRAFT_1865742 [Mycena leptocephala]